mmetsp:Transcript_102313/g.294510  ORF Transcript_102313/g.294510 Transcript_102313/m.294510 type:complete len:724 (+) Transcript_102313:91-2262(+)
MASQRELLAVTDDELDAALAEDIESPRVPQMRPGARRVGGNRRLGTAAAVTGALALMGLAAYRMNSGGNTMADGGAGAGVKLDAEPCKGDKKKGGDGDPCRPPMDLFEGAAGAGKCAAAGEDCRDSRCCAEAGMQCYAQDDSRAECRAECVPGPDPVFGNGKAWSCEKLGERAAGEAPKCNVPGEDCTKSGCCSDAGLTCYEKIPGEWATCKASCTPGLDLFDSSPGEWTCKALGPAAPAAAGWVTEQCAPAGVDCRQKQCCSDPNHQCYMRDEYWGQCRSACDAETPFNGQKWGCETVGSRTPAAPPPKDAPAPAGAKLADWVATTCAKEGENCRKSGCCSDAGMQCYEKNRKEAYCRASCEPGPDLFGEDSDPWTCKAFGPRTPGSPKAAPGRNVSAWVAEECAAANKDCRKSGCCRDVGTACFTKNDGWATCLRDCTPGQNRSAFGDIDDKPWKCEQLGPRTPKPWMTPSFFCFNVIRTVGYEADLIRDQMYKGVGIFSCEEYAVFSNEPYKGLATQWYTPPGYIEKPQPLVTMHLGVGPDGPVDTIPFKSVYVGTSMDHTAGNTQLFLNVWEKVLESGKHKVTDWTIKLDPDAVMLARRVRSILSQYTGGGTYIVNCDKPGMAPMMFGSVEMFSKQAMVTFFERKDECLNSMGWKAWGEDYFMGHCLDFLGVQRTNQFTMVSDGVCKGVNCGDPNAAVFHPMKESNAWMSCLSQAEASG